MSPARKLHVLKSLSGDCVKNPVRRLNMFEPCQEAVMNPLRRLHMFELCRETMYVLNLSGDHMCYELCQEIV